jgi:hypothetical protein
MRSNHNRAVYVTNTSPFIYYIQENKFSAYLGISLAELN